MKIEKSGVLKLFPTYVWATQLAAETYQAINRDIRSRIDIIRQQRQDLDRGGQWQTDQDLHLHPELAGLADVVLKTARGICESLTIDYGDLAITGCWANVSQQGYAHRQHIHPNNFLSGAYYVDTAPGSDTIAFHDPRPQAGLIVPPARNQDLSNPDRITLDVREGMLVMFPAWLQHSVPPNMSDRTRTSVAFNVMFPDFGTRMASPLWKGDTST
jgi:uncharacterized protein (TIGR02466 family)